MINTQLPKNAEEHIARLRNMIAENSECGSAHYNLGVAYMGQQEYDAAEKALHDAIDCSPNLAEAYVLLGGLCLQRNDLEGCLRFNRYAIKARAGFAEGHANIGYVLLQAIKGENEKEDEDMLDQAIKHLRKAIIHNAKFVQAFATLGSAYYMKGLIDEGIKANLEAVKIQPEFPVAHNNLAVGYLERQEYAKAIEHCDRAIALGYDVPEGLRQELSPHRS